ncbi:hypothetical protein F4680DRAFT_448018 [Xylaria scruposa]|nr:hypothetical protein F4680DRAFT_448018 [Xylaria scruposa]
MAANYENRNITSGQLDGCGSNAAILFRACVPTKERLKKLRNGWTDAKSLDSRLLYCHSFNIVLLEQGKLVMKTHDDMVELLENEELEAFVDQVVKEWPESFGQLNKVADESGSFQWHPAERHLDDGTLFLCRVAVQNEDRRPLEPLISPGTLNVCQYPTDNMIW